MVDVPAFSNFTPEKLQAFRELLKHQDSGCRIDTGTRQSLWRGIDPPDAALIVVSLQSLRDEGDALQEYLGIIQKELKQALNNNVVFPFAVMATHKDKFVAECQDCEPHVALQNAIDELKKMANTDLVYAVTNYKEDSAWSQEVNDSTFRLLRGITTLAKNQDVKKVVQAQSNTLQFLIAGMTVTVIVLAMFMNSSNEHGRRHKALSGALVQIQCAPVCACVRVCAHVCA